MLNFFSSGKTLRSRIIVNVGSGPESGDSKEVREGSSEASSQQTNPMVYDENTGTYQPASKVISDALKSTVERPGPTDGRRRAARESKASALEASGNVQTTQKGLAKPNILDLTSEQLSAVQRYLRGENLTTAEKAVLRTVPISQWARVSQAVDTTSSPLITFAVAADNILRVTLFVRNNSRKVYSRSIFNKLNGEEVFVPPDVQYLNSETFNLTFYFAVLENTLNPDWTDVLIYFKDILYSNFYREITPDYVTLESVSIKVITPEGEEPVNKVYSALERGTLSREDTIEEDMVYTYNMYSRVLLSNRNQFQIRLPFVGSNSDPDALESDIADRLESTMRSLSNNLYFNSPTSPGQVVFRLLIYTNKKDAVSPFFPVDSIQPLGFTAPRAIKPKKQVTNNNNTEGGTPQ